MLSSKELFWEKPARKLTENWNNLNSRQKSYYLGLSLIAVLPVGDILTTQITLDRGGIELNPIAVYMMDKLGSYAPLARMAWGAGYAFCLHHTLNKIDPSISLRPHTLNQKIKSNMLKVGVAISAYPIVHNTIQIINQ